MSKQQKNGKCSCWASVNRRLKSSETELSLSFTWTNPTHYYLQVATERTDGNNRKKKKTVLASYCPFCGKKLTEPTDS